MKLWVDKDNTNIPKDFTYMATFQEVINMINRCERNIKYFEKGRIDIWEITEINFGSLVILSKFNQWQKETNTRYRVTFHLPW